MKRLSLFTRILLLAGCLSLIAVLFVPMWRIDLDAPQYPEGLSLLIYPHKLGGNVEIINGLNHYIGMKTLHTEDFIEFTVLPYIIGFFILFFGLTSLFGNRKWVSSLLFLFVLFGIVAMVDFWRWEYNYGHNLDPNAAIIVPGMAYQPPLIGFKQLLNFGAYSIPDAGGWLFIFAGMLLVAATVIEWRIDSRAKSSRSYSMVAFFVCAVASLGSCQPGPEPVKIGIDQCQHCKMTITDARFATELITTKGKLFKFDDIRCMLDFRRAAKLENKDIRQQYVSDYSGRHDLLPAPGLFYLASEGLRSPMAGNIAAFGNRDSLQMIRKRYPGKQMRFSELQQE